MLVHKCTKRVRYGETDQMGYLYYGHYPYYYEIGRTEMIRSLGFSYKGMEEKGVMMPVMTLQCRYVRPAYYDEEVTIQTTLRRLPKDTITFHMELYNEAGELLNGGSVKLCFVDTTTKEAVHAPDFLLEKLAPHFEAS